MWGCLVGLSSLDTFGERSGGFCYLSRETHRPSRARGHPNAETAVSAARTGDARIQALARALTSPEAARFIRKRYQGAVVPSGGAVE